MYVHGSVVKQQQAVLTARVFPCNVNKTFRRRESECGLDKRQCPRPDTVVGVKSSAMIAATVLQPRNSEIFVQNLCSTETRSQVSSSL